MKTLGDHVRSGSPDDQSAALKSLISELRARATELATKVPRSDASVARQRLLSSAADTVDLVARDSVDAPIAVIALATRNVFEINLRARYIEQSDANLRDWISEALLDRIQLYEGMLTLSGPKEATDLLRMEIEYNGQLAQKHGLALGRKPMMTSELAQQVGMKEEYAALFKLYSKLLHPTSYSVNVTPGEVGSLVNRNILLIHLQLYAHDLLGRSSDWIGGTEGAA
jgi:uncharacterized protein DUF5677